MTNWDNLELAGTGVGGWTYNEVPITYNGATDPDSGLSVYYNGIGTTTSWGTPSLNASTFSSSSLNSSTWINPNLT